MRSRTHPIAGGNQDARHDHILQKTNARLDLLLLTRRVNRVDDEFASFFIRNSHRTPKHDDSKNRRHAPHTRLHRL